MAMVPYREWAPFYQLRDEINRLFSSMDDVQTSGATASWIPAVDIHEYDDRFQIYVDLPGVDPSNVDVTLDNGVLTLSGERMLEKVAGDGERQVRTRSERGSGQFHRRFILPESIDSVNIKATGRNGVLEISIRKQAKAQPRRIKVA